MNISLKRNIYGIIGWFILTLIFTCLITEPVMIYREKKQSKEGGFALETDDIIRYSITIGISLILQVLLFLIIF